MHGIARLSARREAHMIMLQVFGVRARRMSAFVCWTAALGSRGAVECQAWDTHDDDRCF